MTGQEMCEEIIRYRNPGLADEAVTEKAREMWRESPDGSLSGVLFVYEDMRLEQIAKGERQDDPEPVAPVVGDLRTRRRSEGGAEQICFDGRAWVLCRIFTKPPPTLTDTW